MTERQLPVGIVWIVKVHWPPYSYSKVTLTMIHIFAEEDAFVCDACDDLVDESLPWDFQRRYRSEIASGSTAHHVFHNLVRLHDPAAATTIEHSAVKESQSLEQPILLEHWDRIEERLWQRTEALIAERFDRVEDHVERRFAQVEGRVKQVEERLTDGLARIEALLTLLLPQRTTDNISETMLIQAQNLRQARNRNSVRF